MKNRLLILLALMLSVIFVSCTNGNNVSHSIVPIEEAPLDSIDGVEGIELEKRVRFVAVGDNIPHDSVINTAKDDAATGEKYNFKEIYKGIEADVKAADIAFINHESPVGGASLGISGYPSFNAPEEMIEELINVGFDVFSISNNHMLDKGEKGYANTVNYFKTLPIMMIGGYTKADYDNIRVVESNGIRIAFLSYTTFVNSGHSADISSSSEYKIPYANTEDITRHVTKAKTMADAVVVSLHWGKETEFGVTSEQNKYATLCANLGVDVVLGHHSHVPGDVEWVRGENGNKTLVAYSLGNFCSSQLYSYNMIGEMLKFDMVMSADGKVTVENVIVDPVVCHYKTDTSHKDNQNLHVRYNVRMYMLRDYTEAMSNSHGSQNWGAFSFNKLKGYVSSDSYAGVGSEFLPDYAK